MPSVVAVRIAECLRKRSIAVEFDEESVRIYMPVSLSVALVKSHSQYCSLSLLYYSM